MPTPIDPDILAQINYGALNLEEGVEGVESILNRLTGLVRGVVSPVLWAFAAELDVLWSDEQRKKLTQFLPRLIGTDGDGKDEVRTYMILDWLARTVIPLWTDRDGLTELSAQARAIPPIVDRGSFHNAVIHLRGVREQIISDTSVTRETKVIVTECASCISWVSAARRSEASVEGPIVARKAAGVFAYFVAGPHGAESCNGMDDAALALLDQLIDPLSPAPAQGPVLVILESPFKGATPQEQETNILYARAAMRDSLLHGEAPMASHLLYTQPGILDDTDPGERHTGIQAGLAWGAAATRTVVYTDRGISPGMAEGIARARQEGRPVVERTLEGWGA